MGMRVKLTEAESAHWLERNKVWSREDDKIIRTFRFGSFRSAISFVNAIAELAESANHHPAIRIDYRTVTLWLTTHDTGGLTALDLQSAEQYDKLFEYMERGEGDKNV